MGKNWVNLRRCWAGFFVYYLPEWQVVIEQGKHRKQKKTVTAKLKKDGFEMPVVDLTDTTQRIDFSDTWVKVLRIGDTFVYLYYDDGNCIHASKLSRDKFDLLD